MKPKHPKKKEIQNKDLPALEDMAECWDVWMEESEAFCPGVSPERESWQE